MIKEIKLQNKTVPIDTNLKLKTLQIVKRQGILSNNFLTSTIRLGALVSNEAELLENISDDDLIGVVYASYINANENYLAFDDFIDVLPINFNIFFEVYANVIQNLINQNLNDEFGKEFKKATPRKKQNSKKKYHK